MIILFLAIVIILYLIVDIVYLDYFKYKKFASETVEDIETKLERDRKEVKDLQKEHIESFTCIKCSGTVADSDILRLESKEYSHISSRRPHKFLKATCKSCGYSELYNLNLYFELDNVDPLPLDLEKYGTFYSHKESFVCPKCSSKESDPKSVYVKRRGVSRLVNFQPNELIALTCRNCFYTLLFDDEVVFEHQAEGK